MLIFVLSAIKTVDECDISENTIYLPESQTKSNTKSKRSKRGQKSTFKNEIEFDNWNEDYAEYNYNDDEENDALDKQDDPISTQFKLENDEDTQSENYTASDTDYEDEQQEDSDSENETVGNMKRKIKKVYKTVDVKDTSKRKTRSKKKLSKHKDFCEKSGSTKRIKKPKPPCAEDCPMKCLENIDDKQRELLCASFWKLNFVQRHSYILKWVEKHLKLTKMVFIRGPKVRSKGAKHQFHFFMPNSQNERIRVCQKFFRSTYAIGIYVIQSTFSNDDGQGNYVGMDHRGAGGGGSVDDKSKQPIQPTETTIEASSMEKCHENVEVVCSSQSIFNNLVPDVAPKPPGNSVPAVAPKPPAKTYKYPSRKKGQKASYQPKPTKCNKTRKCNWDCVSKFTEEQRAQMCSAYWTLDFNRRKDFILTHIETRDTERITAEEFRIKKSIRSFTNRYFLRSPEGEKIRVCADFFSTTLCAGHRSVLNAMRNMDKQTGCFKGSDKRGSHQASNKTTEEQKQFLREHFESYPMWVPNKTHKTRYLPSFLNMKAMYREYQQKCQQTGQKRMNINYFRAFFRKECKVFFLKPTSKRCNISSVSYSKTNFNVSEYTGEEPGGYWITPPNYTGGPVGQIKTEKTSKGRKTQKSLSSTTSSQHLISIQEHSEIQSAASTSNSYTQQQQDHALNIQWLDHTANLSSTSSSYALQHPYIDGPYVQSTLLNSDVNNTPPVNSFGSHSSVHVLEQQPSLFRML